MKQKITLTNGQTVELETNPFGQVRPEELVAMGICEDSSEGCELLGAAPSEMRYGFVHPRLR